MIDDENRRTLLLFGIDNLEEAGERGRPGGHQWEQEVEGEATKKKLGSGRGLNRGPSKW